MTEILTGTNKVSLEFYKEKYKPNFQNYFLPEEQLNYTSMPLEAVAKSQIEAERFPIVILQNLVPAGFFVLHGWEGVKEYSENKDAILVRAYSINTPHQGKGMAKESLRLLPSFVRKHFPDKNEIILAVNQSNIIAQNVYKKGGFIDKGVRVKGRKGQLFIFHMDL
jgi:RimJ/RimL family protein N-acetyltransferase